MKVKLNRGSDDEFEVGITPQESDLLMGLNERLASLVRYKEKATGRDLTSSEVDKMAEEASAKGLKEEDFVKALVSEEQDPPAGQVHRRGL